MVLLPEEVHGGYEDGGDPGPPRVRAVLGVVLSEHVYLREGPLPADGKHLPVAGDHRVVGGGPVQQLRLHVEFFFQVHAGEERADLGVPPHVSGHEYAGEGVVVDTDSHEGPEPLLPARLEKTDQAVKPVRVAEGEVGEFPGLRVLHELADEYGAAAQRVDGVVLDEDEILHGYAP